MKKNYGFNSNILCVVLLFTIVLLAVYSIFFKRSCGCNRTEHFNNSIKLEIYTAPWCGYCKQFEEGGKIQKIKDELGADNVIHYIEGEGNTANKMQENGIEGFPSIIITSASGVKQEDYSGEREVKPICDFYKSKL